MSNDSENPSSSDDSASGDGDGDDHRNHEPSGVASEIETLRVRLAQAEARAADVVARLAHELRTPLGAILMWSHVLRQGRDEDRAAAVDAIEASARTESRLIGRLLDVSRGLAGRLGIRSTRIDVRAPLREALEEHAAEAASRRVALEATLGDVPVPVTGDAERIREIVSILLANGIKFTPASGRVKLTLARAGAVARIDVIDSGVGMAADEREDVFVPFRIPGERHMRAGVGLGVGLALARVLVTLHGGTISCSSDGVNQGSRFTVELPLPGGDPQSENTGEGT